MTLLSRKGPTQLVNELISKLRPRQDLSDDGPNMFLRKMIVSLDDSGSLNLPRPTTISWAISLRTRFKSTKKSFQTKQQWSRMTWSQRVSSLNHYIIIFPFSKSKSQTLPKCSEGSLLLATTALGSLPILQWRLGLALLTPSERPDARALSAACRVCQGEDVTPLDIVDAQWMLGAWWWAFVGMWMPLDI